MGIRNIFNNMFQKVTTKVLSLYMNLLDSDFGWINFLSGIMISSSIGTLDSYCTSEDGSVFELLSAITTGISSWFLFCLYQKLSYIVQNIDESIALAGISISSPRDFYGFKKSNNKKAITENARKLTSYMLLAGIFGVLGIAFLILCFVDKNPNKIKVISIIKSAFQQNTQNLSGAIS